MSNMSSRSIHSTFLGLLPLGTVSEPQKPVKLQAISRIELIFDQKKIGAYPKTRELLGGCKIDVNKLLAAARKTPGLSPIEWDGDRSSNDAKFSKDSAGAVAYATRDDDPRTFVARRRKIRDRYISARCPGVARSAAGNESYTLKFNRVRSKGRGWILAGFEIVPTKNVETLGNSEDAPDLELVFEDRDDDPWSDEVSPRLQSR